MHYANGREAKIGDQVVFREPDGAAVAGTLVQVTSCTDTCNGRLVPPEAVRNAAYVTLSQCLHVDDAFVAKPEGRDAG